MTLLPIPNIFLTTIVAIPVFLSLATLIGRSFSDLLPYRLRPHARFYLAPAFGLASLTILLSMVGRVVPLGNVVLVIGLITAIIVWVIINERHKIQAIRHALTVSVFGIICGVSILGPLLVCGAFNAHNDAFTYLVHSGWLQSHAFGESIHAEMVTPLTTQVSLYQHAGFRMGASFLLAFLQALFRFNWASQAYPTIVITAVTVCCLGIGFPLSKAFQPMRRSIRLALLSLPAFSLGGIVFGAHYGFLPQIVGFAMSASLLFLVGPLLQWMTLNNAKWNALGKAAIPCAVLVAGATYAYSEMAPFIFLAAAGSGIILCVRFRFITKMLVFSVVLIGISTVLLNTELIRAYSALRMQSGAVVGSPVDWSLLGYLAHAFGIHGGAWEAYQWSAPENAGTKMFAFGLILLGATVGILASKIRPIWRATLSGVLLPSATIIAVFAAGMIYFRYFVSSPFPRGVGQSWSQFKLTEWAHPFMMVFVLFALANYRQQLGKLFKFNIASLFFIGLISAAILGIVRINPIMHYYKGVSDLNQFYLKFRDTVFSSCPNNAPIYLALRGENLKFRQMAALYLSDRDVSSDWSDDVYIFHQLPGELMAPEIITGSCVVEPISEEGFVSKGAMIGPFQVGIFNRGIIQIVSVDSQYSRESDGQNWWYWVERKVSFKLNPMLVSENMTRIKLSLEYGTIGNQRLNLQIKRRDLSVEEILLPNKGYPPSGFVTLVDLKPSEIIELSVETDGEARRLGESDDREAAFIVRNLKIAPVSP